MAKFNPVSLLSTLVMSGLMLAGTLGLAGPSRSAPDLTAPSGRVILEVSGAITRTNAGDKARFDRAMLESLGFHEIKTTTPWTDGLIKFEGVLARDLFAAVGATGRSIRAVALNDFVVDIPLSDFTAYPVIVAMKMNGKTLRVRDKGPLWVIYPWRDHEELQVEQHYSKAIWQLARIVVRE